jgi:REP element-mobilizing transposase RayT
MVIGYHLIWTAYGWWLPNDPRGSSSQEVRVEAITKLGDLHTGRKENQPNSREFREFYKQAQDLLAHPLLVFDEAEIALIATSFCQLIQERGYLCHSCALMPDHVHLLIRRHQDRAEEMIEALQRTSRDALIEARRRSPTHPVWGGPGWKVFLNTPEDIARVDRYIRDNPVKAGKPEQIWEFVRPLE